MNFAIYEFEFGYLKITYDDTYVVKLEKVREAKDTGRSNDISDLTYAQIDEYLKGNRKSFTFPYKMIGTDFQIKVWQELTKIPYGQTRSYKDIAIAIGNEKACRAVGLANNKNPLFIVVPCHRVIGSNGKLVGYAGGMEMKKKLLEMEMENTQK